MILLGCPTYDGKVCVELIDFAIEIGKSGYDIRFDFIKKQSTDIARNTLVSRAQMQRRHLIMVDSDAIPEQETFKVIADKIMSEECVVGVPYCASGGQICVNEHPPSTREAEHLTGIREVDNIGTHLVGYNINVFYRIEPPYFEYDYTPHHTGQVMSEDYVCHRKLRAKGVKIYCAWDYWAGHIVTKVMDKPRSLTEWEKAILVQSE